ncbi:hypothetical protein KK137_15335 [Croceibacterium sp. LX-88]|uniref:Uncharacterized protein n=1 Tax=Croceibacterium selenioxidans TaxID=2838833 RepID=A0ABS5W8P6_9SPHN|nr:hypothetical protein [Croceibacterium selenioxidans]MBT2135712.1 hypothetical protein [Croceibacterium selenioxidans]
MTTGPSGRRQEPLYVIPMALALILAAIFGAAFGLVWHAAGFGAKAESATATPKTDT